MIFLREKLAALIMHKKKMKYEDYISQGSTGDRRTLLEETKNAGKASTKKVNRRKKAKVGTLGALLDKAITNS